MMLQVRRGYGDQCDIYGHVQRIRSDVSTRIAFDFDRYSFHYLLLDHDSPVGCATIQQASDGPLDCESYYPPYLRGRFKDQLFTSCKFRVRPNGDRPMEGLRLMIRDQWMEQLSLGRRATVINATERLVRFYQRLGFTLVRGCEFIHPVLQTHSHVLVMAADPGHRSICQDLFKEIPDPVSQLQIVDQCEMTSVSALVA